MENLVFYYNCNVCEKRTPVAVVNVDKTQRFFCTSCEKEVTRQDLFYYITCPECERKNKVPAVAESVSCRKCKEDLTHLTLDYKDLLNQPVSQEKNFSNRESNNQERISYFSSNFIFMVFSVVFSIFLLSNQFGDMAIVQASFNQLKNFSQYFFTNLIFSILLVGIFIYFIVSLVDFLLEILIYTVLFGLLIFVIVFLFGAFIFLLIKGHTPSNLSFFDSIRYSAIIGFIFAVVYILKNHFIEQNLKLNIFLFIIFPSLLFFTHSKLTYQDNSISSYTRNSNYTKRLNTYIINYFKNYRYSHRPRDVLYRSEGYASFPNQSYYVLKHGIFSKRLVAKLLNIPIQNLQNDCKLNYETMGRAYERAYKIKEQRPAYFYKVYNELLEEVSSLIQRNSNRDPIKALCNLHTGFCMWESYLISTGDYNTATGYRGDTYEFIPKSSSNPLTFYTGRYCGVTKNAVLLWISPDDYKITKIR